MYKFSMKNKIIFFEQIIYIFPEYIKTINKNKNNIHIFIEETISNKNFIFFIKFLKKHSNFKYQILTDITAIDLLTLELKKKIQTRFYVNYNLLSIKKNTRIFIYKSFFENNYLISLEHIYKSANWLEREIWDLFGIFFLKNEDLRRILTDYGFEGFPLRKDFPLTGYLEISYNEKKKSIIYKKTEVAQEFRNFKFLTPWI